MNYCSFCGKAQHEVFKLVAGPNDIWPDQAVLSKTQTSALTNLSEGTLDRLHQRGEGPPRVQLSTRRVGYRVGAVREWIEQRISP